jgi:hypothetical protein
MGSYFVNVPKPKSAINFTETGFRIIVIVPAIQNAKSKNLSETLFPDCFQYICSPKLKTFGLFYDTFY